LARPPLVAIGPKGWADDVDLTLSVAGDEEFGIHRAAVGQVRAGEEVTYRQVLVDGRAHHAIRHGRGHREHLGDEMRLAVITGFGQVDFVAHPLDGFVNLLSANMDTGQEGA
jgi:hypothetical protein